MRASVRYALVFTRSTIAGVYLHEIGHAVAGLMQGIAIRSCLEIKLKSEIPLCFLPYQE